MDNTTISAGNVTTTFFSDKERTVSVVLNLLLGLTGLVGNSIVCLTIKRSKYLHDITYYLIASLALSDLLCCVFFIISILCVIEGRPLDVQVQQGFFGEVFCRLFWSLHLFWSSFFASAFNLVVVTFERYYAIVHPLAYARWFTERRALMLAGAAWALGFFLETEFPIRYYVDPEEGCVFPGLGPNWFAKLMFLKSFVVSFVAPLIFLIWAYHKILKTLRDGVNNPERGRDDVLAGQQAREMHRASRRVVQSLLIITTLFVLLLLPSELGNVLLLLEVPGVDARLGYWEIFRSLTVMNSVVNPMIYAIKMKKFRKAMKLSLCSRSQNNVMPEDTTNGGSLNITASSRNES